ncbi:N-acetylglucosamine-6-sulfatase-like [Haliotis cracherodii]|uniref:N-acetylglucosamine-6-sulfatase-like n=1 Tax=Haliotis cracherodii TaxID=6455 RepID=UPI0039E948BB
MAASATASITFCLILQVMLISVHGKSPNIVFVLTDDQDVALGGQTPMVKTKKLVGDQGIIFNNMFVTSPLCCPSRSSIFTGKFVHNHGAQNNSISGGCSSTKWQTTQETTAFPTHFSQQGYTSFFAGKYLNAYGLKPAGGVQHVPPGWDWWNGLVGNSVYYNYTLSINGTAQDHGQSYKSDYLTDLIHRQAMGFLQEQDKDSKPFFMMMSTPACHGPFTPAPQYSQNFSNLTAPRNGSFNKHGNNKHWLIEQAKTPMPNDTIANIDNVFRNRWRTLLSVDDMVEDVVNTLDKKGLLDNTFVFFSSDNGFHLGQFSMPEDKRQFYDFDIRVPLMVRGPGVKAGQVRDEVVLNIDLAPTFIELTGSKVPDDVDGLSLLQLLEKPTNKSDPTFRTKFLVEHDGESKSEIPNCPQFKDQGLSVCSHHCVCEDSTNNTYACVVETLRTQHYKYCQMQDSANFVEVYDLVKDPAELNNIVKSAAPSLISQFSADLARMSECKGKDCRKLQKT